MKDKNKTLVIGLDGGTFRVLDPLSEEGWIPNITRLMSSGVKGVLRSTVPPTTAPAWSSFITGKNPGKHGIFDFLQKKPLSYREFVINSCSRKGKSLWRLISEAGKRVVVLNVPTTYPPEKINGIFISGFLTPSRKRDFVYPSALLEELKERFGPYYLHMKTKITGQALTLQKIEALIDDCTAMLNYKAQVAEYCIKKMDPEFCMLHVWGTDRIQHELWDVIDPTHKDCNFDLAFLSRNKIRGYYRAVDSVIGKLTAAMGEETSVVILSDHGFGPIERVMDLNAWLLGEGYIHLKKDLGTQIKLWVWEKGLNWQSIYRLGTKVLSRMKPPKEKKGPFENLSSFRMGKRRFSLSMADVDWTKTKAYAKTGMGQIVINVQGRESHGCVQPGQDYEEVQQEIIKKLSNLVDPETGQSIKGDLYRREDVYKGPFLESAPDIVFIPMNNRYLTTNLTGFYSQKVFNDVSVFYGNHTMEGLFIASGPKMKKGVEIVGANIIDLAPTILFAMGIPILDSMDGKVLSDIFKSEFLKKNPIKFQKETDETGRNQIGLNHLDQEEALERLKDLGYI